MGVETPGSHWRTLAWRDDDTGVRDGDTRIANSSKGESIFDELVVDHWLHLEQMDEHAWWLRVGDARVWVDVSGDEPVVHIQRGAYGPVRGRTERGDLLPQGYVLMWRHEGDDDGE